MEEQQKEKRFYMNEEGIVKLNNLLLQNVPTMWGNQILNLLQQIVKEETLEKKESTK